MIMAMKRILSLCLLSQAVLSFVPPNLLTSSIPTPLSSSSSSSSSSLSLSFLEDLIASTKGSTTKTSGKVEVPPNFELPEPKPLALPDNADIGKILSYSAAAIIRLATGAFVLGWKIDTIFAPEDDGLYSLTLGPFRIRDSSSVLQNAPRPDVPLILYEYPASPFCKRIREVINLLDLTVEYRPCPGARTGFSDELFERTGRRTVPYLIDPNTGIELFESSDQIEYLLTTYGPPMESFDRKALWPITFEPFSITTSISAAILQQMPGSKLQSNARLDNNQMKPIELWSYECSPFVGPVREKLSSLGLAHVWISCPRGSINRNKLYQNQGRFQVPFLRDPNTGIEMFEGAAMADYLESVYTTTSTTTTTVSSSVEN